MNHKLSVLVQIDLDGAYVRLVVTGCLTEANQHALHALVGRVRTELPPTTVTVDLTDAVHVEAAAVDLLRWAIADGSSPHVSPVRMRVPNGLPGHRPGPAWHGHGGDLAGRAA
ncbi:hypothetical protein ACSNO4_03870 [Kocuria flava]|uniref:hypothetical protein n=1 Tax=Kocuria flava TaxID=446860 RepID=UPI003F1D3132